MTAGSYRVPSWSSSSSDTSTEVSEQNTLLSPLAKNNQLVPRSDTSSPSGSTPGSPFNCSVDVLLSARVKLDATNDVGRTALHLAAVCARGDYMKKLLAAGANPNVQDNWGQSPLHASIGAVAEGAFHLLTNFPKTEINLKSDGGLTPLMDAVKSTNLYMVKQLVKKNADISLADDEGRTAVHWAAMVDNAEALKVLLRQGPDTFKDTQDNKGQTPLFLACRESATECAKHLLDVFAQASLPDNLDRSPMDIAFERQHQYIMELLIIKDHYKLQMARRQQVPQHLHPYPPSPTPVLDQYNPLQAYRTSEGHTAPWGQTIKDRKYLELPAMTQPPPFPYATAAGPQSSYNPNAPFPSRQNIPYPLVQPLPTFLSGQTVGYASPVTSTLSGAAGVSYTPLQQPSGSTTPTAAAAFPNSESFPTAMQGAPWGQTVEDMGYMELPAMTQPPPFPYATSADPQSSYNPNTPFPSRQNIPYPLVQPLPTFLSGQTVGYASPVTSTLSGAAGVSYTPLQQPSGSTTPTAAAAFPNSESFPTAMQGVPAPSDQPPQQTTTPPQGWNH